MQKDNEYYQQKEGLFESPAGILESRDDRFGFLFLCHSPVNEGGIGRFGRLLCAEAARSSDVKEVPIYLEGSGSGLEEQLANAASHLSNCGSVLIQFSPNHWGGGKEAYRLLAFVCESIDSPVSVVFHDSGKLIEKSRLLFNSARRVRSGIKGGSLLKAVSSLPRIYREEICEMKAAVDCLRQLKHVFVFNDLERDAFARLGVKAVVVPHFVAKRTRLLDKGIAKRTLGFECRRVVTLMGYVVPRKGHGLAIRALAAFPEDVHLIIAGGSLDGYLDYTDSLKRLASDRGVLERVHFTGYLTEVALEQVMAATDVAVCPFESVSASGSLSDWIACEKPIVVTDLPQLAGYRSIGEGVVQTFKRKSRSGFVAALERAFRISDESTLEKAGILSRELSLDRVWEQYRAVLTRQ